ncbi:Ubiquitin-like modifier-activating enzyme 5 [Hibiscus syriacus]|uniref:Ubiquitin-like modifier-activating enzyme 5 n=1 Tax=Hibiscus syriacus TaxID=106335 RepID=A0A6A3AHD0_HIBSY|nr:Ubiquitin-like modifier-activating enzyme 5 [Hibiscus syriacus]
MTILSNFSLVLSHRRLGGGFYSHHKALYGPGNKGEFGESPNYGGDSPIASTWRGSCRWKLLEMLRGGAAAAAGNCWKCNVEMLEWRGSVSCNRVLIVTHLAKSVPVRRTKVKGIGGVGSVAAEMLTRCGIGRLLLYDYDKVEFANMNRLFFRPEQVSLVLYLNLNNMIFKFSFSMKVGMTKTDAAVHTLSDINPDVLLESYTLNITIVEGFETLMSSLKNKHFAQERKAGNELNQAWMESVSGHIQLLIPGETASFACAPPLLGYIIFKKKYVCYTIPFKVVASGMDEQTRGLCRILANYHGSCGSASSPKYFKVLVGIWTCFSLLGKSYINYLSLPPISGYNSLKDFFPTMAMKPNPQCSNAACLKQQKEYILANPSRVAATKAKIEAEASAAAAAGVPLHVDNEWNIRYKSQLGKMD